MRALLLLLPVLFAFAEPAAAQTALADSVRRDLWTTAYVDAMRQRAELFDETIRHAVLPNDGWVRRLRPIARDAVLPYYPTLSLYEAYHDRERNPHRWNSPVARTRRFTETPELPEALATHAYRVLTNPVLATAADAAWKRRLERLVEVGWIPSPQANLGTIARAIAPQEPSARQLRDQLLSALAQAPQGSSDAVRVQFAQAELRRTITNPDSVAGSAILRVTEGREQIDRMADQINALPAGSAKDRAEEARDALLGYNRSHAQMAGAVLRFVDPEIGKAVVTVGEAALKASEAYQFLTSVKAGANIATAAAMGDMVSAGLAVAQLFMKSPDPASVRHQQLVRMLRQIGLQLEAIQNRLNIVDQKVTEILSTLKTVQAMTVDQTLAVMRLLMETEGRLIRAIASARMERSEEYRGDHLRDVDLCTSLFPEHGLQPTTQDRQDRLTQCMRAFVTFGTNVGVRNTFIGRTLDWRESPGLLPEESAVDYLGSLPGMVADLASISRSRFPDVSGASSPQTAHPGVVAAASLALIELSLRQPRHRISDEREVFVTLRQDLVNYRIWSDSALARSRAPDGGGLAAYDSARAAVLRELRLIETQYLQERDSAGPNSALGHYCAATLKTDLVSVVGSCARNLPRLSDPLETRDPLDLARYALYFGRGVPGYTWDWTPKTGLRDKRECSGGGGGIHGGGGGGCEKLYTGDGTFTLLRSPNLSVAGNVILGFSPLSQQVTVTTGWHGRPHHAEHWRQKDLEAKASAFHPSPGTWTVVPAQRWLTDSAFATTQTETIVNPLRPPFARYVSGLLASNDARAQGLQHALSRLDHIVVAWRGYERLALGECFTTSSNYAFLARAEAPYVRTRAMLVRMLQNAQLMEFVHALEPLPTGVRAALPLASGNLGACSRIPPDIDAAIDAIDRYLALRAAEQGN